MQLKYITEPKEQYVTRSKAPGMKYTRTTIHCPLCKGAFSKREFEDHVYRVHGPRADEAFAMLFGLPWPAKCSCGRALKYSRAHKGFPVMCGNCTTGQVTGETTYSSQAEAEKDVAQLQALLARAKAESKRLAREAELEKVPLAELPFPSRKDPRLLQRISKLMRTFAINGEKDELIKLANFIDGRLKALQD